WGGRGPGFRPEEQASRLRPRGGVVRISRESLGRAVSGDISDQVRIVDGSHLGREASVDVEENFGDGAVPVVIALGRAAVDGEKRLEDDIAQVIDVCEGAEPCDRSSPQRIVDRRDLVECRGRRETKDRFEPSLSCDEGDLIGVVDRDARPDRGDWWDADSGPRDLSKASRSLEDENALAAVGQ